MNSASRATDTGSVKPRLMDPLSPGQHLQALAAAFFRGNGWVDEPFSWVDYDEAGHAEWETMAEVIGKNLHAARAAPELLQVAQLGEAMIGSMARQRSPLTPTGESLLAEIRRVIALAPSPRHREPRKEPRRTHE